MVEIIGISIFTPKRGRTAALGCMILSLLVLPACRIKKTIRIEVPPKILQAKTASLDELLENLREYDKIQRLASSIDITYSYGKKELGVIQEIRKQPGYILLERPDSTYLVVQNFVTRTRELEVLSKGDDLSIFYRPRNALYVGKNSATKLSINDLERAENIDIPIRGKHIYESIFPHGIQVDLPGYFYSLEEQTGTDEKYYILSGYRQGTGNRIHTVRRLWIERSSLSISRQQLFLEDGRIESDITYKQEIEIDGIKLPLHMHVDRPIDGYALNLEFKSWRINPNLPDNAFSLQLPEGVQIIHLKE